MLHLHSYGTVTTPPSSPRGGQLFPRTSLCPHPGCRPSHRHPAPFRAPPPDVTSPVQLCVPRSADDVTGGRVGGASAWAVTRRDVRAASVWLIRCRCTCADVRSPTFPDRADASTVVVCCRYRVIGRHPVEKIDLSEERWPMVIRVAREPFRRKGRAPGEGFFKGYSFPSMKLCRLLVSLN